MKNDDSSNISKLFSFHSPFHSFSWPWPSRSSESSPWPRRGRGQSRVEPGPPSLSGIPSPSTITSTTTTMDMTTGIRTITKRRLTSLHPWYNQKRAITNTCMITKKKIPITRERPFRFYPKISICKPPICMFWEIWPNPWPF